MNRRHLLKTGASFALGCAVLPHRSLAQTKSLPLPPAGADGWVSLLNGRDLTGWYTMLEKSGKSVAEAKKMVTMEEEMLHILGNQVTDEHFEPGYLATNQEFENVRIRLEYKWGMKQFEPRSLSKRDNGLLYGLVGADKVWPTCVECQIEEGDVGDFFLVSGVRGIQGDHGAGLFAQGVSREHGFPTVNGARAAKGQPAAEPVTGRLKKDGNFENLNDWNVVEVIWQGDQAAHLVNGRAVNSISGLQQPDPQNPGKFIPLTRGKIAIEIEFAEIWFRRIEVKSLV
ncbi:3-keto-disaccharide hydrolase [Granulicella mallensis]|uniref:3-keto-alpha-glucoside-1,2-lyase/3-keto-2-hydroxy-glucal hydratase domain-containing protein n=1 Tax=Granulicella mallensis (strain ATCC BAA-1857 / DSM 23137 / MP5ACTX8) TaxID=682795 RepID=G8NXA8_GRAMM|nr:DUF1080 domain-containing protein [Granulicella mallensis]AEU37815.1 protein of unknown function DUF1080 [Granulicella mallensis MP5ACTX8]